MHLCLVVNFSLQLKHKPCARRRCIFSQVNRLYEVVGEFRVIVGDVTVRLLYVGAYEPLLSCKLVLHPNEVNGVPQCFLTKHTYFISNFRLKSTHKSTYQRTLSPTLHTVTEPFEFFLIVS